MREQIKQSVRKTGLYRSFRRWKQALRGPRKSPVALADPPPAETKRENLIELAEKHALRIFVETGTYQGDTVETMRSRFARVVSIELDQELHERAMRRFGDVTNVELIQGNSGEELAKVLQSIDEPALFWLDGHYSGDGTAWSEEHTPILREIAHVLDHDCAGHVMVVDDARLFGTDDHYPTLDELTRVVRKRSEHLSISVKDDSIRIEPRRG